VSVDDFIESAQRTATWMREQADVIHQAGLDELARSMVERADDLEAKASWALATPSDESRPGGGWVDDVLDHLKLPWMMPTRSQVVWLLHWARRARAVVRHLAGVAEAYNEPATKVAAAQRLLDEIETGPEQATRSGTIR